MFALAVCMVTATLQRGENPYDILGVPRDANQQQIKQAFRKIAFDSHPDRNKGEEAYRTWIRANDAYEILSNPSRKSRFDETGEVSEEEEQTMRQNTYGQTQRETTPLITQQVFPFMVKDGCEWMIFAYQTFECPQCSKQSRVWESLATILKDYVKVARIDATQAPDLMEQLGVTKLPQYLSVKLVNGTYKVAKLGNEFKNEKDAVAAVFRHWNSRIVELKSEKDFQIWIQAFRGKVHVLQNIENDATMDFRYVAAKLGTKCVFATMKAEFGSPTVKLFRGMNTSAITIESKGMRLLEEIKEYSSPLFPILKLCDIEKRCKHWCVGFVGSVVDESIVTAMRSLPFSTALIVPNSTLAKQLKAKSGHWFVFVGMKAWKVSHFDETRDLIAFCSNLYRADSPLDILRGSPIEIAGTEWSIPELLQAFLPFEIIDQNLVIPGFWIVLPISLVLTIIGSVFLVCLTLSCYSKRQSTK